MTYKSDGVLRPNEMSSQVPPAERLKSGPVVVVECVENIPCNPCADACPRGAIVVEGGINDTPRVDHDACNGCGLCISACPGLAIFVVDQSRDDGRATVMLPYEFLPLPEVGEVVFALDREGRQVCEGRVVKVVDTKALDRTPIVSLEVPDELAMEVRHLVRREP